jgi:hypothetical protein
VSNVLCDLSDLYVTKPVFLLMLVSCKTASDPQEGLPEFVARQQFLPGALTDDPSSLQHISPLG